MGAHDRPRIKPNGFLLHGYVSVAGATPGHPGSACQAVVPDIAVGQPVKITDEDGVALASGRLDAGVLAGTGTQYQCNFGFDIRNVPGAAATMVVEVGMQPAAKFPTQDLKQGTAAVIKVAAPVVTTSR